MLSDKAGRFSLLSDSNKAPDDVPDETKEPPKASEAAESPTVPFEIHGQSDRSSCDKYSSTA